MGFAQWIDELPASARASILWKADHESGDLREWTPNDPDGGGGIFNTGGAEATASATTARAHSGRFGAVAKIKGAYRGKNGARAVRLMRWTDAPWRSGGREFPLSAYFSTWMLVPENYNSNKYAPWDPGDGGWWNVFQFKSHSAEDESQPAWSLQIYHNDARDCMVFGLYSSIDQRSVEATTPVPLPVGRWVHVEIFYACSASSKGQVSVWQDGCKILEAKNVRTVFKTSEPHPVWGIGNYTDHVVSPNTAGAAQIFFDDCIVSTSRISKYLPLARSQP